MSSRAYGMAAAAVGALALALVGLSLRVVDKPDEPQSKRAETRPASTRAATRPGAQAKQPTPTPDLSPAQVVRVVMDALKNNDADDSGIAVTFDFASPGNKEATGPLARFIPMVKSPVYGPMLNHRSSTVGKVLVRDDEAQALVTLIDAKGEKAAYVFRLSRQPDDGDPPNCWLTDGVIRVKPDAVPAEPKLEDIFGEDEAEQA